MDVGSQGLGPFACTFPAALTEAWTGLELELSIWDADGLTRQPFCLGFDAVTWTQVKLRVFRLWMGIPGCGDSPGWRALSLASSYPLPPALAFPEPRTSRHEPQGALAA